MKLWNSYLVYLSLVVFIGCNNESTNSSSQSKDSTSTQAANSKTPPPPPSSTPTSQSTQANAPAAVPSENNLPNWQPNQSVSNQLDEYVDIEGYQIRNPKGYKPMQSPSPPPGVKYFAWAGDPRDDGSRPMVMVMLLNPPEEAGEYSREQVLDSMLNKVKKRRENWQQTPTETGKVNGITFLRTYWQGQDSQTEFYMHGMEYAAKDGSTVIEIRTQDIEPHHTRALKIGNASILTFRKK